MKYKNKAKIQFFIDPQLHDEERDVFLLRVFHDEKIKYITDLKYVDPNISVVIFCSKKNIKHYSKIRSKIIVTDSNQNDLGPFESINFNSIGEISYFINKIFYIERKSFIQNKIRESEKTYEQIKKINLDNISTTNPTVDFDHILDLELQLLQVEDILQWNTHLKNFSKKCTMNLHLTILNNVELFEENNIDENSLVFKLPFNNLYILYKFKQFSINEHSAIVELILTMILRTLQLKDQNLIRSDGEIDFWKKVFSKIPYPMAVISDLGDLLLYNESFAKIGILPKECLRFKDQESIEIFQQFYKVRRLDFPIHLVNVSYLIFYTNDDRIEGKNLALKDKVDNRKASVDELGIISSSIAHELNNPLAGILAAISLLNLEDIWSGDELADLEDMKNGAKRCKELVEIFLGFSKFSPKAAQTASIKQSADQAINLLRFRMIESNLRLELKYTPTLETFSRQINSSIMSMILYLILSELMTSFAHERLISQSNLSLMSGEILEFSNQIIVKLEQDFEYEDKLAQSKLIQHLLLFEKLEINFLTKEIRLIYRG
jgi:signal transduction histidine kinase